MLDEVPARKLRADQRKVGTNGAAVTGHRVAFDAGHAAFVEKDALAPDRIAAVFQRVPLVILQLQRGHLPREQRSAFRPTMPFVNAAKLAECAGVERWRALFDQRQGFIADSTQRLATLFPQRGVRAPQTLEIRIDGANVADLRKRVQRLRSRFGRTPGGQQIQHGIPVVQTADRRHGFAAKLA